MYPETVVEAWESYYKENGLSWLAPQVQAAIKQAFFSGMEAVEHNVQLTGLAPCVECSSNLQFVTCSVCGLIQPPRN